MNFSNTIRLIIESLRKVSTKEQRDIIYSELIKSACCMCYSGVKIELNNKNEVIHAHEPTYFGIYTYIKYEKCLCSDIYKMYPRYIYSSGRVYFAEILEFYNKHFP